MAQHITLGNNEEEVRIMRLVKALLGVCFAWSHPGLGCVIDGYVGRTCHVSLAQA